MASTVEEVLENRLELLGLQQWVSGFSTAASAVGVLDSALDASQRKQLSYGIGFAAVSAGIVAGLGKAVRAAGDLQQTEVGFKTMLGSAEAARAKIEELQAFAAGSPFDFGQSAKGAQQLLAMGVSAQELIPIMQGVGNATAAAGGDTEVFLRAIRSVGQIKTKGVLQGDELLQLSEAGIPAVKILQEELGLTTDQVRNIGKAGITSEEAIEALTKGFNKRFGGAMEAQNRTLGGSFSNLTDSVNRALAAIGKPLLDPTVAVVRGVTSLIDGFNKIPGAASAMAPVAVIAAAAFAGLAIKSALAVVSLGKLAAENVTLANQELKTKAATDTHTTATLAEAAAHDAAAAAAGRHAAAEAQLGGGYGGGGTGGAGGTQKGPRKSPGVNPAQVAGTAAAAAAKVRGGAMTPGDVTLPPIRPGDAMKAGTATQAAETAAKMGIKANAGGKIGKFMKGGTPVAIAASIATDLALNALPDEGAWGVTKRVGQGAATGATYGALAGSFVPVVGTAAGAAIGGTLGAGKAGWDEWQRVQSAEREAKATALPEVTQARQTDILERIAIILDDIRKDGKRSPIGYDQVSRADQVGELLRAL